MSRLSPLVFFLGCLTLSGTAAPSLAQSPDPATPRPVNDTRPAWSPDGAKIAFQSDRHGNFDLFMANADGSGLVRVTTSLTDDVEPSWSPDGKHIAFASNRHRDTYTGRSRYQIYVTDIHGTAPRQLMVSEGSDFFPVWSPDGERIAFLSDRDGQIEVFVANADGSGVRPVSVGLPGADRGNPTWSPDGRTLAFDAQIEDKYEILAVQVDGSGFQVITEGLVGDHWYPAWSPIGGSLAFGTFSGSGDNMSHRMYALDMSTGALTPLTTPTPPGSRLWDYFGVWSPDGSRIAFASNRSGAWRIFTMNADGSGVREVGPH